MDSGSKIGAMLKLRTVLLEIEIHAMLKPRSIHIGSFRNRDLPFLKARLQAEKTLMMILGFLV